MERLSFLSVVASTYQDAKPKSLQIFDLLYKNSKEVGYKFHSPICCCRNAAKKINYTDRRAIYKCFMNEGLKLSFLKRIEMLECW